MRCPRIVKWPYGWSCNLEYRQRLGFRRSQVHSQSPARCLMAGDVKDKHILDTNAWNDLFEDPDRDALLETLETVVILPTALAISELAATEDAERRHGLLRLVKRAGQDNRPLATPNQLMILACQGYARRDAALTLNGGADAEGAWIALNDPKLVDAAAQRMALSFNQERETIFRKWNEGLRHALQRDFRNGVAQPRSMSALIRHYGRNDDFLYGVVNLIYERSVGTALPRNELWPLLRSVPYWPVFLMGYACAFYQRAVRKEGFGHKNNPGHLDLWSAAYLPACDVFVTSDRRMRRVLRVINRGGARPARIISYTEWRQELMRMKQRNCEQGHI
jgi:hypothetical protein